MKPKDKILSYEQARELRWFCKNVVGVRTDFNEILTKVHKFDERVARLEITCKTIDDYFKEHKLDEYMPFTAALGSKSEDGDKNGSI